MRRRCVFAIALGTLVVLVGLSGAGVAAATPPPPIHAIGPTSGPALPSGVCTFTQTHCVPSGAPGSLPPLTPRTAAMVGSAIVAAAILGWFVRRPRRATRLATGVRPLLLRPPRPPIVSP